MVNRLPGLSRLPGVETFALPLGVVVEPPMNATPSRGLLAATTLMMLAFVASTAPAAALMNPEPPCLPVTDAIAPPAPINSEVDTGKVHDALATINGDDGSDPTDVQCQRGFPPVGKGGGGGDRSCIPPPGPGFPGNVVQELQDCLTQSGIPGIPQVVALADFTGACKGTHEPIAEGSASATVEGGAVIKASVSVTESVTQLEHYDFACTYAMTGAAIGFNGFLRNVRLHETLGGTTTAPLGMCSYTGAPASDWCDIKPTPVLADQFGGSGIASPFLEGRFGLPTEVTVCPRMSPTLACWRSA